MFDNHPRVGYTISMIDPTWKESEPIEVWADMYEEIMDILRSAYAGESTAEEEDN